MVVAEKKLGRKGQIHIPKNFLENLGIKAGEKLILELKNGEIILRPKVKPEQIIQELDRLRLERKESNMLQSKLGDLKGISLEEEFDE